MHDLRRPHAIEEGAACRRIEQVEFHLLGGEAVGREPVGAETLADFVAAAYGADHPLVAPVGDGPMNVRRTSAGAVLEIALPFATSADVDLARHGDELVVTVGSYRRLLALPAALTRLRVAAARVEGGALQVRFVQEVEQQ